MMKKLTSKARKLFKKYKYNAEMESKKQLKINSKRPILNDILFGKPHAINILVTNLSNQIRRYINRILLANQIR